MKSSLQRFYSCLIPIYLLLMGGLIFPAQKVFGQKKSPAELVNPFVDTHNSRWFYFNSATRPFGMVNLSPDTNTEGSWESGYLYDSDSIRCFSHIHAWQMSGVAVMPVNGEFKGHLGMDAYQSSFSHDREKAVPGYHQVFLESYDINAELTSTTRVGFHRYTFPEGDDQYILFDAGAYLGHGPTLDTKVWQVNDKEIAGYEVMAPTRRRPKNTPVYFVARIDKPAAEFIGWENNALLQEEVDTVRGENAGAAICFATAEGEQVRMKVSISYVSVEQARKNMEAELPHWDFDQVKNEAYKEWNNKLSRIKVNGGTKKQRVKFYTDLWHALQGRRIISDVDGRYMDMTGEEPEVKKVDLNENGTPKYPQYNFDAWWGSHWSLNILWSMVYPEVMDGFANTMVNMYKDGGLIPRGPSGGNYTFVMIGDPAVSFLATAYNKGIRNFDTQAAYEGVLKNAYPGGIRDHAGYEHANNATGGGMDYYVDRGYVPEGLEGEGYHKDGASMTLEYAFQDWCLAQLAEKMGKEKDHQHFLERSSNYKHLWHPEKKFMHPREKDGSWIENFESVSNKFNTRGFCEANSAIYTYYVPHDLGELVELFGGKEKFNDRLNEAFEKEKDNGFVSVGKQHAQGWVDYANQPGTGMAHLFNYSGAPWLTQHWVREVKAALSDTTAYGGYNGDEDQGQMGALGVLMAMGLFEMDGGANDQPIYEITSPLFDKITIKLNQDYYPGEEFVITTGNNDPGNKYIQGAQLNGKKWDKCWFYHSTFAKGGHLNIELGPEPEKSWGSAPEDSPARVIK